MTWLEGSNQRPIRRGRNRFKRGRLQISVGDEAI
jgi:hypothetical protein